MGFSPDLVESVTLPFCRSFISSEVFEELTEELNSGLRSSNVVQIIGLDCSTLSCGQKFLSAEPSALSS